MGHGFPAMEFQEFSGSPIELNIFAHVHRVSSRSEFSESDSESSSSERKNRGGFDGYQKMNRKSQTHKRMRKKRTAIPVQPPKVPCGAFVTPPVIYPGMHQKFQAEQKMLGNAGKGKSLHLKCSVFFFSQTDCECAGRMYGDVAEEESSIDVSSPRENNSPIVRFSFSVKRNYSIFMVISFSAVRRCAQSERQ